MRAILMALAVLALLVPTSNAAIVDLGTDTEPEFHNTLASSDTLTVDTNIPYNEITLSVEAGGSNVTVEFTHQGGSTTSRVLNAGHDMTWRRRRITAITIIPVSGTADVHGYAYRYETR